MLISGESDIAFQFQAIEFGYRLMLTKLYYMGKLKLRDT